MKTSNKIRELPSTVIEKKTVKFIRDLPTRLMKGRWRRYCIVECPYCFKEFEILKQNIKTAMNCGCVTALLRTNIKHGFCTKGKKNRLYQIWADMKTRCNSENNSRFHRYGGRGISVCKKWNNFVPFKKWASLTGYKNNLTIDRKDNDGNYSPSNCRWVTIEQNIKYRNEYWGWNQK